jgi:hypothetical protein
LRVKYHIASDLPRAAVLGLHVMNARQFYFSGIAVLLQLPLFAYGAGLVPCGGDGEEACQMCHTVQLINGVSAWLVGILSVVAAIMFILAGFKILMAGGNSSALQDAKSMITNVAIGFVIVLASWLLIDLMMKTLLGEEDAAIGPWNAISCVAQPESRTDPRKLEALQAVQLEAGGSVGITGGAGTSVTELPCTEISATEFDCFAARQQCTGSIGGTVADDMSGNQQQTTVTCVEQVVTSSGSGGSCTVITDTNNACHPSKLNCFGNADDASQICNLESSGGNSRAMSGSDRCADGKSFSGGLWQINILANNRLLPGCSANFFTTTPSAPNACDRDGDSAQGGCLDCRSNSAGTRYCAVWNCRIKNDQANITMYNHCVSQTKNSEINSQAACSLYNAGSWGPWITSADKCGVS